jgi:hypothetical protein
VHFNRIGHANVSTAVIASNRGRVWDLFDNPHHKKALQQYGLRPNAAISCAFLPIPAPTRGDGHVSNNMGYGVSNFIYIIHIYKDARARCMFIERNKGPA